MRYKHNSGQYLNIKQWINKKFIPKIFQLSCPLRKIAVSVFALVFINTINAQQSEVKATFRTDSSVYYARMTNGMTAVMQQINSPNLLVSYNVKIGPVYENDTISGISYILQNILSDKIKNYLSDIRNPVNSKNTSFNGHNTSELSIYQFAIPADQYSATLKLIRDTLDFAIISKEELSRKIQQVKAEIEADRKNYLAELNTELTQRLFRKDAHRLLLKGDTVNFKHIDIDRIRDYYSKYYVPNNSIIDVTGKFDVFAYQKMMADTFHEVIRGKYDPEVVTRIVDFKAMIYNTRIVVKAPVQQPEVQICWQFPGTRSNTRSSYYAFLLTAILNDPNNYIQVKTKKMGCRKLFFDYDPDNFSGILKVIIDPDKKHFYQTYSFVLNELKRLDKTLVNESTLNAGKVIIKSQMDEARKSRDYAAAITRYWIYNSEAYLPTLTDSVMAQNESRMHTFVVEYLNRGPYVTAILVNDSDRVELKIDSLLPPVDESANNYSFAYRNNIYNLEGAENFDKLYNLVAWLKENPDLEIQINGIADTKEVSSLKDDSIAQFIDSIPSFQKSKKELIKNNSIRLEMLRAMTIIKFLYDHGIEAYRLKGTSRCFTSKTKEEQKNNMICTIGITKIIRGPSLYEYHFGKPKDAGQKAVK